MGGGSRRSPRRTASSGLFTWAIKSPDGSATGDATLLSPLLYKNSRLMRLMVGWQRGLSVRPGFANRGDYPRIAGLSRVAAGLPHDSQSVDGDFPLWTECRIEDEGTGANPGHWVIPAFALGKCRDFSTSLSPGEIMSLILASNSEIRRDGGPVRRLLVLRARRNVGRGWD